MPRRPIYGIPLKDRMSISLPEEQREAITELASREHRPAANIVRLAIAEFLEKRRDGDSDHEAPTNG